MRRVEGALMTAVAPRPQADAKNPVVAEGPLVVRMASNGSLVGHCPNCDSTELAQRHVHRETGEPLTTRENEGANPTFVNAHGEIVDRRLIEPLRDMDCLDCGEFIDIEHRPSKAQLALVFDGDQDNTTTGA